MAVGDVYQIIWDYTWAGGSGSGGDEVCNNVYWYRQTVGSSPTAANDLANAFSAVGTPLVALAPTWITFTRQQVVNYRNPLDFTQVIYNVPGTRAPAGEKSTPVNNVRFYSGRPFPGARGASKQYPFLAESDVVGKNLTAVFMALQETIDLRDAHGAPLTSNGQSFVPVVIDTRTVQPQLGVNPTVRYEVDSQWSTDLKISYRRTRRGS